MYSLGQLEVANSEILGAHWQAPAALGPSLQLPAVPPPLEEVGTWGSALLSLTTLDLTPNVK